MTSIHNALFLTAILLAPACGGGNVAQAGVRESGASSKLELAFQFEPGTSLRYRTTTKTEMGGLMGIKHTSRVVEHRVAVREQNGDGDSVLELTIESVKLHIEGQTETIAFDSSTDESSDHPMLAPHAALVGTTETLTVTPRGEIMDAISENAEMAVMPGGNSNAAPMRLPYFLILPADGVGLGDEWNNEVTFELPPYGSSTSEATYQLKSADEVEGAMICTIAISSVTYMSVVDTPWMGESGPRLIKMSDDTGSGEARFDMSNGQLVESRIIHTMNMEMLGRAAEIKRTETIERIQSPEAAASAPPTEAASESERIETTAENEPLPPLGRIDLDGIAHRQPGNAIIFGALDKSLIDEVINQNLNRIRYCYQRELQGNPVLSGKVTEKFTIAKNGTVSEASPKSSTLNNAAVEECINKVFMEMKFPEPRGGGIVIVSYPFVFSPS